MTDVNTFVGFLELEGDSGRIPIVAASHALGCFQAGGVDEHMEAMFANSMLQLMRQTSAVKMCWLRREVLVTDGKGNHLIEIEDIEQTEDFREACDLYVETGLCMVEFQIWDFSGNLLVAGRSIWNKIDEEWIDEPQDYREVVVDFSKR